MLAVLTRPDIIRVPGLDLLSYLPLVLFAALISAGSSGRGFGDRDDVVRCE